MVGEKILVTVVGKYGLRYESTSHAQNSGITSGAVAGELHESFDGDELVSPSFSQVL